MKSKSLMPLTTFCENAAENVDERSAYGQIECGGRAGSRQRSAEIAARKRGAAGGGQEASGRAVESIAERSAGSREHESRGVQSQRCRTGGEGECR